MIQTDFWRLRVELGLGGDETLLVTQLLLAYFLIHFKVASSIYLISQEAEFRRLFVSV